jgi:hypothetical protein
LIHEKAAPLQDYKIRSPPQNQRVKCEAAHFAGLLKESATLSLKQAQHKDYLQKKDQGSALSRKTFFQSPSSPLVALCLYLAQPKDQKPLKAESWSKVFVLLQSGPPRRQEMQSTNFSLAAVLKKKSG